MNLRLVGRFPFFLEEVEVAAFVRLRHVRKVHLPEAAREGVVFAPGESFHIDAHAGRGRSDMRLNFTYPDEGAIEEGVRRLGVALTRLAERADLSIRNGLPIEQLTPIV